MPSELLFLLALSGVIGQAQTTCTGPPASAVSTVDLPSRPFGIAISADGCSLFASMFGARDGSIAVLARKGSHVALVRTVPLPTSAAGVVLTHDGKLLIAAALEKVVFLDAQRLISGAGDPILGSFADGKKMQSIYANVTADDKLLFVSEEAAEQITVIDLERARATGFHADSIVGKIPVGHAPIALTFSPDGRWLYTTSQAAMKEWGWPAACTPEGRPGNSDRVNPEGAVIAIDVARAKTDPAHSVTTRVPAGCSPVRMAISQSGERIYVTARNSNAVVAFETAKLTRVGMASVGTAPVPIALIDGDKKLVVGNSNRFGGGKSTESLTVLDAAKIDVTLGNIPAGAFPRELRTSPDGQTLYLANFGSKSLQVMDVTRIAVH
jgi:DNA-binding beta-propeller fold protein YncE